MLLAINARIKGWLGIVVVALIALPFALWGIQSYIGGADETIAASVSDREISIRELDAATTRVRQKLQQQSNNLPDDEILKRQALDQIINTTVLETSSYEQGYRISDNALAANMMKLFQRDGKFDNEYFKNALASQGMTPQMFEQRYRSELRMLQLQDAITSSAIVSDADLRRIVQLDDQKREFVWLRLNIDKLASDISVSDDEIEAYYQSRIGSFMTPEKASIEYIELTVDDLPKQEIDKDQLQLMYDDYLAANKAQEERKARHILITLDEGADKAEALISEIQDKLKSGADFAELAKQYSKDPGSAQEGGDLDWVEVGQMVKPFEDALFALDKNQISDVVKTEFGLHLIKLDDVRGKPVKTFAEMRPQLLEELQRNANDGALYELSELMANTAYENPDSLEPVAEALGLQIKTTDSFTATSGSGISDNPAVRAATFSDAVLTQGENSELIEIAPDHVLVLRVKEHQPATPIPLSAVRNQVVESIKIAKGEKITSEIAEQLIAELKQGKTIDDLVKPGIELQEKQTISKSTLGNIDKLIAKTVLEMQPPAENEPVYQHINLASGDGALIILQKVSVPEQVDEKIVAQVKSRYLKARANEDFNVTLDSLKNKSTIHINQKVFDQ